MPHFKANSQNYPAKICLASDEQLIQLKSLLNESEEFKHAILKPFVAVNFGYLAHYLLVPAVDTALVTLRKISVNMAGRTGLPWRAEVFVIYVLIASILYFSS